MVCDLQCEQSDLKLFGRIEESKIEQSGWLAGRPYAPW